MKAGRPAARRITSKERTREYLLSGRRLDLFAAIRECGTSRPAEYVRQLREEGLPIQTITETSADGKRYGVYVIAPEHLHRFRQTELFRDSA